VADAIEYEQFDKGTAPGDGDGDGAPGTTRANGLAPSGDVDLSRLSDIPMELSVEIGRTHMTVGETLDLRVGSVVALERLSGETADLLVNGTAIAHGEVVVIDEQYGLRITEIVDSHHDGELAQPAGGDAEERERAAAPDGDAASAAENGSPPDAAAPQAAASEGASADEGGD
jgi:flagellar motor switch protein FliN/FliY